jgi:riboflavin biosynthesis pyrimidine reductase
MRQLLPVAIDEVDVDELYAADDRTARQGRPWVLTNMVASVDGASTVDGSSGQLGGAPDRQVFAAIRAVADVIMVGAGTVRAEGYGPPTTTSANQARRATRGQQPFPRLAVVTSRLELDLSSPLFTASPTRPLLLTGTRPSADRLAGAAEVADVLVVGDEEVDVIRAVEALAGLGAAVVLCEGGPTLDGQLVAAGVVDEVCLTVGPVLAAGSASRIMHGPRLERLEELQLDRVLEQDSVLALRYVRA